MLLGERHQRGDAARYVAGNLEDALLGRVAAHRETDVGDGNAAAIVGDAGAVGRQGQARPMHLEPCFALDFERRHAVDGNDLHPFAHQIDGNCVGRRWAGWFLARRRQAADREVEPHRGGLQLAADDVADKPAARIARDRVRPQTLEVVGADPVAGDCQVKADAAAQHVDPTGGRELRAVLLLGLELVDAHGAVERRLPPGEGDLRERLLRRAQLVHNRDVAGLHRHADGRAILLIHAHLGDALHPAGAGADGNLRLADAELADIGRPANLHDAGRDRQVFLAEAKVGARHVDMKHTVGNLAAVEAHVDGNCAGTNHGSR